MVDVLSHALTDPLRMVGQVVGLLMAGTVESRLLHYLVAVLHGLAPLLVMPAHTAAVVTMLATKVRRWG
jgi:hypothetical protein